MAKVSAPLMSMDASGALGKTVVFGKWKGVNYARSYFVPMNPNTLNQQKIRSYFSRAVQSWHLESAETKEKWNLAVRGKPLTGFNYYVAQYIKYLSTHDGQAPGEPFLPPSP
ncbi:hypothetical protein SAMN00808754_3306 [Thermanaeromonas toyohensis ToBE]|uniref:Uncharacterized protein n=1 Tax=Thermanaeromonas toyohensis ToBE TaxID=698762 RepID=A0A1W1W3D3_9FIRM|nr:hypothetical protein [Thermanaeromonas toyohensis]SMC00142.1 hypothetical protein SAMN00808754_3306 [Thermanaeromonas toyohensis ToBE]